MKIAWGADNESWEEYGEGADANWSVSMTPECAEDCVRTFATREEFYEWYNKDGESVCPTCAGNGWVTVQQDGGAVIDCACPDCCGRIDG